MKAVYVDTSVLLRIVFREPRQLDEWDSLEAPATSVLAEVEGLRAIDRATRKATHPRKKPLNEVHANEARVRLHENLGMFLRVQLDPAILARAGQLTGPLGTLDALHLATALTWGERDGVGVTLATHDPELGPAARACGLSVIGWPEGAS